MADHLLPTPGVACRYNGVCKACKKKHSVLAQHTGHGKRQRPGRAGLWDVALFRDDKGGERYGLFASQIDLQCTCGRVIVLGRVFGTVRADKKCDGRCMAATGHVCECACGGKNHGAAHG